MAVTDLTPAAVKALLGQLWGWPTYNAIVGFGSNPIRFLKKRIVPLFLGGLFGIVFDVADALWRPFEAIIGSLGAVGASLAVAVDSFFGAFDAVIDLVDAISSLTAVLGPLKPYADVALLILVGYFLIVIGERVVRAIMDAIPGLSGLETFIWG